MQAITIGIGKTGIQFFAQHYLLNTINHLMNQLQVPDRTISIPDFGWWSGPGDSSYYSKISIVLTHGALEDFSPVYQGITQSQTSDHPAIPIFTLAFQSSNFSVKYNWMENYNWYTETVSRDRNGSHEHYSNGISNTPFSYNPTIGAMTIPIIVQFAYNTVHQAWEITAQKINLPPLSNLQINIPKDSILQHQDNSCGGGHANQTTMQMVGDIDFATPINKLIAGILATIPGSGNLGNGIVYDFSLGGAGLAFPNNDGIQMAVKGGASYNGVVYTDSTPPELPWPMPPLDTDSHHLFMYVSNYEVDALCWGYFQAGKLDLLIQPIDIPDPDALKVHNYVALEPSLKPFSAFVMNAQITQNAAPKTSFQIVYFFNDQVMALLAKQLPANINQLIQALQGDVYISKSSLEDFLISATVPNSYFSIIENASKISAMTLTQDMEYALLIQNNQQDLPYIKFRMQRVDILTNLVLGINTNQNQTMQFSFANSSNSATFVSSSIPGFDGSVFGTMVWPITAEPLYAENLINLGKTGVPLPVMKGLEFDFENSQLSLQEGYVSILANVLYKNSSLSFAESF